MRHLFSAGALTALVGTRAAAGRYTAPMVEGMAVPQTVVIEEATSSST